jgi:HEPN domain-containing protein
MKPSTREWVKKAETDYQLAVVLSRRRKVTFHDHGCFACQQSAEKYLKAKLEEVGILPPKTHDLAKLLKLLLPVEPLWTAMLPTVTLLTDHAVEFRYPGHEATAHDFKKALKAAQMVRKEARASLGLRV